MEIHNTIAVTLEHGGKMIIPISAIQWIKDLESSTYRKYTTLMAVKGMHLYLEHGLQQFEPAPDIELIQLIDPVESLQFLLRMYPKEDNE